MTPHNKNNIKTEITSELNELAQIHYFHFIILISFSLKQKTIKQSSAHNSPQVTKLVN